MKNKSLCETHICSNDCRESFLPLDAPGCLPLKNIHVSLAGVSSLRSAYQIGRLAPPYHVVLLTLRGKGRVTTPSESLELKKGSLLVLPAGGHYEYRLNSPNWRIVWFHLGRRRKWRSLDNQGVCQWKTDVGPDLSYHMQKVIEENYSGAPDASRTMELHAELLAIILTRTLSAQSSKGRQRHEENLRTVLREVEEDLSHRWNVVELAKMMHVAPGHLHRIVNEIHGCSVMRLVTQLRMRRAATLLKHSTMTIAEIAEAVGYGDPFAFSNAFRRQFDMPPSIYRQRH